MRSYHFSLGNSDSGAVGFCARVQAENLPRALEILKEQVDLDNEITSNDFDHDEEGIEYLTVYINTDRIGVLDVTESEIVA